MDKQKREEREAQAKEKREQAEAAKQAALDKMKARGDRFGVVTADASTKLGVPAEDAAQRAARLEKEAKLKARAERFGGSA